MASSRIKLLSCIAALSLMMGCVPILATPTPIPPLDPNAIGTYMVQTADAASTQTVAALPPTPTITPTSRSTFTPESTFTPAQFVFPSMTPAQRVQYYRLKHDAQLAIYNFKSRTHDENSQGVRNQTPEVVPLFAAPKLTAGSNRTTVSGAWETYIDALNDYDQRKLKYLKSPITALFNDSGFPQMESLTMGGNIITLAEVQGDWGRVNTLNYVGPPDITEVNYVTRPDLVHKFVIVGWKRSTRSTVLSNPPQGAIYYPFVSRHPVWVQMERLEPFPILPMLVTAYTDISVQTTPGPKLEKTRIQFSEGESQNVIAYYPSGSSVWGRLQSGGWIPLLHGGKYFTSWSMATVSPP